VYREHQICDLSTKAAFFEQSQVDFKPRTLLLSCNYQPILENRHENFRLLPTNKLLLEFRSCKRLVICSFPTHASLKSCKALLLSHSALIKHLLYYADISRVTRAFVVARVTYTFCRCTPPSICMSPNLQAKHGA
jgi:hypothetical protein